MNRFVVFGIAMFFAIVGIALLGADNKADAGQRCCGCAGASCAGCDGGCYGCAGGCGGLFARKRCCGCAGYNACCGPKACCGLFARMRARKCCGCAGYNACCQPVSCCGCAGAPMDTDGETEGEPEVPPAPKADAASTMERAPMVFRSVSFRR